MSQNALDQLCVNTIKMLAADAIEKANSGHPGLPMGCADIAYVLWTKFLRVNPKDPHWINRDRFVLSAGHGSMLLYALLHLSGFDLSIEDLKKFRQWGSLTPGHPEFGHTQGVECTTGPLGQGTANAVGMALAAKMSEDRFNTKDFSAIDHKVFALISDGDLMEGISNEAASLAGHLKLSNLVYIYDSNQISIDGSTSLAFTEDIELRFKAQNWWVQKIDGHDHNEIEQAIQAACDQSDKPCLIIARTHIGHGSPGKQDSSSAHGAPLGKEELQKTKENLHWPLDPDFEVPTQVREHFAQCMSKSDKNHQNWKQQIQKQKDQDASWKDSWEAHWEKRVPSDLYETLCQDLPNMPDASRSFSSKIQQKVAQLVPALVGGSADLASSCKTWIKDSAHIESDSFEGRNLHFGIREHAMGAILNGMSLYGSFIPYGSTFLVFSDYMRPAIRLAALSKLQSLFIFTHDSLHVGEDGPTHQPVEHIPSLRLIPNVQVLRPADALESAACWTMALDQQQGPSCMILSRQNLSHIDRSNDFQPASILKGAYVVKETSSEPALCLIATGSEVALAQELSKSLEKKNIDSRVVSAPCLEVFSKQDQNYKDQVLPKSLPCVALELSQPDLWYKYLGPQSLAIGIEEFGASAPGQELVERYGFSIQALETKVLHFLETL
ncbi:MAG: transketolase [Bdellovibrionales bacterium]|nr:transketolase [Bdellovibrionales bacterium]